MALDGTLLGGSGLDSIGWLWMGHLRVALDGTPLGGPGWDTFGWLWVGHHWVAVVSDLSKVM